MYWCMYPNYFVHNKFSYNRILPNRTVADFMLAKFYQLSERKEKKKMLDEKGVFGRVYRHDYLKGFHSIKFGERYLQCTVK